VTVKQARMNGCGGVIDVKALERALQKAQAASDRASEARRALPPGSSRARVTTANARWMRAAEERDRVQKLLDAARDLMAAAGRLP
jgi:hypothetical protein